MESNKEAEEEEELTVKNILETSEVKFIKELRQEITAFEGCSSLKVKFTLLSVWSFIINIISIWQILYIPYFICFQPPYTRTLKAVSVLFDIMYILVIVFRVYKLYLRDSLFENRIDPKRKNQQVKNYFKGFFFLDLLSAIPFGIIGVGGES